jgi:putative Mg2+ transporter-C (MgtC) family protein
MTTEDIALRVFLSILLGGIFGAERTLKKKPAGFITLTLVCLGAAMVAMLQLELNDKFITNGKGDIARLTAQVISGVGFIGGGTIMYTKGSVHGITTAALLWVSACLGLSVGYGFFRLSIISATGILMVIIIMRWVEEHYIRKVRIVRTHLWLRDRNRLTEFMDMYQNSFFWNKFELKTIKPVYEDSNALECSFSIGSRFSYEEMERKLREDELIQDVKKIY